MRLSRLVIAVFCSSLLAVAAQAQGMIWPRPCPRPLPNCPPPPQIPQQPLKLKSIHFKTKITDQVAVTHVEQIFENDTSFVLEGIYFFPLPDQVSITEFAMWDGDKRLVGEVRPRDEARRVYNDIVRSRRDPALLEYAGKNLFQASVFPIAPHSDKKIELTYSQPLEAENGTVAYRYPLGTGWRANGFIEPPPRPIPMPRPRPIDDGRQWDREQPLPPSSTTGQPPIGRITGEVEIASRVALKNIYSPSHDLEVKRDGERKARLSFESRAGASQRDFQLYYSFSDQDFGLSLLTYREPGKDGYFMLFVAPKAELDEKEVSAKEVVFVLDTSGSMAEAGKMDKAKAALRYGVNALGARDRFNIISFAGEEHLLSESLLAADDAGKKQALEFIEKMKAAGGTNINDALLAACKQLQSSERPQMIVLLTDGQPTVGETQANRIMANAKESNKTRARLFTFGVGYDVNTILLDALANDNRGTVAYIEPNEDIEVKVSSFFSKVNHPVLSDLKIDWGGAETDLVYPRAMPDLFHGSQMMLVGRYRPSKRASVKTQGKAGNAFLGENIAAETKLRLTLTGKVNGRERRFVYDNLQFPEKQTDNEFLPHLWAMRRVGFLLDQIRLNGESKEVRDEVVELGTRYGIVTPYTSYLVLEPGTQVSNVRVPEKPRDRSERRSSVSGGVAGGVSETVAIESSTPPRTTNLGGFAQAAGRDAVIATKKKEELSKADKVSAADPISTNNQLRQVGGKTFYLRDGVWTDSEFKADAKLPVVNLKFASDEYFSLIGQEPKLADCFALGKRVTVVWNGKVYRVEE